MLIVDYVYDAFKQLVGVRTSKPFEDGQSSTAFVHDGGQVALQFDAQFGYDPYDDLEATDLSHRYLWGPAVDQLLADEQVHSLTNAASNETLWALADRQGSITDMVDNNGTERLHRAFDSFGNVLSETHRDASGSIVTSGSGYLDEAFEYTGRLFDKDTGLQNNLNRWYDPKIGRWMSEDPIEADVNSYRYVGNSPTNYRDPNGLDPFGDGFPEGPPYTPYPIGASPTPSPRPTPPPLPPPGTVPGQGWKPGPDWGNWRPIPDARGGGVWEGPGGQSLHPDPPHGKKPGHCDWTDEYGNQWEGYHGPPGGPPVIWKPKPGKKNNPNKPQPLFPPGSLKTACVVTGESLVLAGTIGVIIEYGWPLLFAF